jgi:hypothetical protein
LLLSDNFNSASYGVSTVNDTLAADQSGTIDPIIYTVGGSNAVMGFRTPPFFCLRDPQLRPLGLR